MALCKTRRSKILASVGVLLLTMTMMTTTYMYMHSGDHGKGVKDGPCRKFEPVQEFIPEKFTGAWHIYYTQDQSMKDQSCILQVMTYVQASKLYSVTIRYNIPGEPRKHWTDYKATVAVNSTSVDFDLYSKGDKDWNSNPWHFTLIGKIDDERNYTLAYLEYACQTDGDKHNEFFQIIGRFRNFTDDHYKILSDIAKVKGNEHEFMKIDHKNCNRY